MILKGIKPYEIVVDAMSPASGADITGVDAYNHHCHTMLTIFIQQVCQHI